MLFIFGFFTIIVIIKINSVINAISIRITGLETITFFFSWRWELTMTHLRLRDEQHQDDDSGDEEDDGEWEPHGDLRCQMSGGQGRTDSCKHFPSHHSASPWPELTDSCVIIGEIIRINIGHDFCTSHLGSVRSDSLALLDLCCHLDWIHLWRVCKIISILKIDFMFVAINGI